MTWSFFLQLHFSLPLIVVYTLHVQSSPPYMSQPLSKTASHAGRAVFRPRSEFPEYRVALAQLKGHQTKALTRMQQLAPQINLVLELRDSRTPLSSSNVLIDKIFKGKDKVIVYTKGDMSPLSSELLSRWHAPRNETFVELDCRRGKDIHKVLGLLKSKYGSWVCDLWLRGCPMWGNRPWSMDCGNTDCR